MENWEARSNLYGMALVKRGTNLMRIRKNFLKFLLRFQISIFLDILECISLTWKPPTHLLNYYNCESR